MNRLPVTDDVTVKICNDAIHILIKSSMQQPYERRRRRGHCQLCNGDGFKNTKYPKAPWSRCSYNLFNQRSSDRPTDRPFPHSSSLCILRDKNHFCGKHISATPLAISLLCIALRFNGGLIPINRLIGSLFFPLSLCCVFFSSTA